MGSSNENSAFGPARNPWALDRTPGGSSGGSAAAVAARILPLALGSDTGGSIRQPAAMCGVVGLKPTYGRVSRYGLLAFGSSLDQIGPLTTTAADAARALQVIAGLDAADATSASEPVPDYPAALTGEVRGVRLGVPRRLLEQGVDTEVMRAFTAATDVLASRGATIVDVEMPHAKYAIPVYYLVATAEASSNLARYDGVRYGFRALSTLPNTGAPAIAAGPDESDPSDLKQMYAMTREQGFGPEVKRRIMLGTYVLSAGYYDAYYLKAQQVRTLILRDYEHAFASVDARDADEPDRRLQARRAGIRPAPDVPGGCFHGERESRRATRHQRAVRVYLGPFASGPAIDGARLRRVHAAPPGRRLRARHELVDGRTS
jgi:aspartyl-tRNA(Asn)/glutamyl-tRNA(Gln) amidotransferase subunit A